jgi:hypothetical protein
MLTFDPSDWPDAADQLVAKLLRIVKKSSGVQVANYVVKGIDIHSYARTELVLRDESQMMPLGYMEISNRNDAGGTPLADLTKSSKRCPFFENMKTPMKATTVYVNPLHDVRAGGDTDGTRKGLLLSDYAENQRVRHLFRGEGVVSKLDRLNSQVHVRFEADGQVHRYKPDQLKMGKLALVGRRGAISASSREGGFESTGNNPSFQQTVAGIAATKKKYEGLQAGRELKDYRVGQSVTDFIRGAGKVTHANSKHIQVEFVSDGSRKSFDKAKVEAGNLAIVASKRRLSVSGWRGSVSELQLGDRVSHFHRGIGSIQSVSGGAVHVSFDFEDAGTTHAYDADALAIGKLRVVTHSQAGEDGFIAATIDSSERLSVDVSGGQILGNPVHPPQSAQAAGSSRQSEALDSMRQTGTDRSHCARLDGLEQKKQSAKPKRNGEHAGTTEKATL